MKCPKCGYLGFETTDRCRNCQYDFSLAPFSSEPELTLHGSDRKAESPGDFDLPPIKRQTDSLSATALDLDRLFGAPEPSVAQMAPPEIPAPAPTEPVRELEIEPAPLPAAESAEPMFSTEPDRIQQEPMAPVAERAPDLLMNMAADDAALPFDDAPLMPPPAARPPLAVRRSSQEVPRNRPRTTRPVKLESLNLEPQSSPEVDGSGIAGEATETVASLLRSPTLAVRVGAGLIDLLLLAGIDAAILYLTLQVTGLQNTLDDLRVLPLVPFAGFLALLAFGYVAAFTVAGGQTIGKMMLSLRVIGDDGRPVDPAGGMLRALGCMLVPVTLGLSYLPAIFTSDHRALHDRLAGTRVVQE